MQASPLLVFCSFPDEKSAREIGKILIEKRLAACMSFSSAQSMYRWRGEIESVAETTALIKTSSGLFPALSACIVEHHPYEVPEIMGLPISEISPAYREWLLASLATI